MPGTDDLSRSLDAFEEDSTLVSVIDMSLSSWVVLGLVVWFPVCDVGRRRSLAPMRRVCWSTYSFVPKRKKSERQSR